MMRFPNGRRRFNRRPLRGFTLVELLLAMTIGAIVLATTYSAFSIGLKTRRRLNDTTSALSESRAFLDQLSRELRNTISFDNETFEAGEDYIRLRGYLASDLARIIGRDSNLALSPEISNLSPIIDIEYFIVQDETHTTIEKRTLNLIGHEIDSRSFRFSGPSLVFSYFDGNDWLDTWEGIKGYPRAVTVQVAGGDSHFGANTDSYKRTIWLPTSDPTDF